MVEPVSFEDATISPTGIKQIQADQTEPRKHMHKWETAKEVYCNLNHFKEWLPRSQWARKEKAQIYLLYNCLPTNLQKKLVMVEWIQNCAANHAVRGSLKSLEDWILTWRHVRSKTETALSALYGGELKQRSKEQLSTWYEKTQEVGEDAFGPNKYILTLAQRRLVASVFIEGARYRQANHYLLQNVLEGLDERAIKDHLYHCSNVFNENKGCEKQHPYVAMQREADCGLPRPTTPPTGCPWTSLGTPPSSG